jgi:16S rRNA (cytidine1402-2'-O)-methyltransferase
VSAGEVGPPRMWNAGAEAQARGKFAVVAEGAVALEFDVPTGVTQMCDLIAVGARLNDAADAIAEAPGLSKRDTCTGRRCGAG